MPSNVIVIKLIITVTMETVVIG